MKNGSAFFIALRYLLGRGREGGRYLRGAAIGIGVSLIPIVVTLIVADGMIRGITDRYLELGTGHLEIYDFDKSSDVALIRNRVLEEAGVTGAWAERQGLGILVGPVGKSGTTVRAVDDLFLDDPGTKKLLTLRSGTLAFSDERSALLGEALAKTIGAKVGDTVRLMTLRTSDDGRAIPRLAPFTVRGIVSSGYQELDALWCLIPYHEGLRMLSPGESRNFLLVKVKDPYRDLDRITQRLAVSLGDQYGVYPWKELQQAQYRSFESTRQLLLFIMALIVIVAAVNVSSATSMLVVERRRDIAILKSFGVPSSNISRIFTYASFLTGVVGSLGGIAVGLIIGYTINDLIRFLEILLGFFSSLFHGGEVKILNPKYYLETIPVVVDWVAIAVIWGATVLCSVIAALRPARRAGKLSPTEILRKY